MYYLKPNFSATLSYQIYVAFVLYQNTNAYCTTYALVLAINFVFYVISNIVFYIVHKKRVNLVLKSIEDINFSF